MEAGDFPTYNPQTCRISTPSELNEFRIARPPKWVVVTDHLDGKRIMILVDEIVAVYESGDGCAVTIRNAGCENVRESFDQLMNTIGGMTA